MPEVIVVGGGIIGLLTARALHLKNVDVLLIERGPLGGESSWAGGGIISPLYPWRYSDAVNRLAEKSKTMYPALAEQLQDESSVDCELLNSGLLVSDSDELERAMTWAEQWQVHYEHVQDDSLLKTIEPAISPAIQQALWFPDVQQIRNPKIVKALQGSFEKLAIPFKENTPVDEIIIEKGDAKGVRCCCDIIHADKVIVASGAWSQQLVEADISVEPVKGQMIMYKGEPGLLRRIILSNGHYVIPRKDGRILAGSTLERTGFDKSTSDNALNELSKNAQNIVPLLAELEIERQWAGLRPGTENGIPYICESSQVENLYIHAGHYRNGIVLGPASVQLMTEIVLGEKPWCDVSDYRDTACH